MIGRRLVGGLNEAGMQITGVIEAVGIVEVIAANENLMALPFQTKIKLRNVKTINNLMISKPKNRTMIIN